MTMSNTDLSSIGQALENEGHTLGIQRYDSDSEGGVDTHGSFLYKRFVKTLVDALANWLENSPACGRGASTKEFFRSTTKFHTAFCACAVRKAWKGAHLCNQVSSVVNAVGQEVSHEYIFQKLRDEEPHWAKTMNFRLRSAQAWEVSRILRDSAEKRGLEVPRERAAIGMVFIELMIEGGLFTCDNKQDGRRTTSILTFTPEAKRLLEERAEVSRLLSPVYPPMVEKPLPWETVIGGGYRYALRDRLTLLREGRVQVAYLDEIHNRREALQNVFKAINAMQDTGYRINKRILAVVERLEHLGKSGTAGIPSAYPIPEPETPLESDQKSVWAKWRLERQSIKDTNAAMESKRRSYLAQLSAARQWKDYETLYFPCTVDWRWRIYPVGTAINPQSDTIGKSLLEFAEGKHLESPDSIDAFKVCGAGLFGNDKVPLEERIAWADEITPDALLSADDPFANTFWMEADEPLRFLSWCYALSDWVDGNPLHFIASVDGSQNGIQHYALLSRCEETARQVNVAPSDSPADLYTAVRDFVAKKLSEDIASHPLAGIPEGNLEAAYRSSHGLLVELLCSKKKPPEDLTSVVDSHAQLLSMLKAQKELDRTLVKRPVMTFSYSVTSFGITEQLISELHQRDLDRVLQFDKHWIRHVARELTARILEGIHQAVTSAAKVMDWLCDMATNAVDEHGCISWVTPMGVPIVQRYTKGNSIRIRLATRKVSLSCTTRAPTRTPDRPKARSGIAPNLIHSFDAAHLQLTVLKALAKGVDHFSMIHDSYGTHAEDLPKLSRCLRESAVEIYSRNQLEEIRKNLGGSVSYPLGNLDIKGVLKSKYFFC